MKRKLIKLKSEEKVLQLRYYKGFLYDIAFPCKSFVKTVSSKVHLKTAGVLRYCIIVMLVYTVP